MKKLIILSTLLITSSVFAQSSNINRDTRIKDREARQEQRIQQGLKTGELTTNETQKLEQRQQHIKHMEENALKDGNISQKEGTRIEHAQNKQNREISNQTHDAQHDLNHDGKKDQHNQRT